MKKITSVFGIAVITTILFASGAQVFAAVTTDKDDYAPGETVTISGDGYFAGETVYVEVTAPYGMESGNAIADGGGNFSWQFVLPNDETAFGSYSYTATGLTSGIVQSGTFTDGNVKAFPLPTDVTFSLTLTIYSNTTCGGSIVSGPTVETGVSDPSGETTGVGNTESVLMQAAALSDQGTGFIEWTTVEPFVATSTTVVPGDTICISGNFVSNHSFYANYEAPPTTATLTLLKEVTNDNGGSAADTDWTLSASGPTSISGAEGDASITNAVVDPGSYDLSESGPLGYSASDWDCTGDGTQDDEDTITLAAGESAICTITNDDIQPLLTVTKTVVNDNGGTLTVGDFPLFVDATGVTSGVQNGFDAGSYTVSETPQSGYAPSDWGGDCAADGSITLEVGGVYECTITNDDVAPTLTLVKTVENNDDGVLGVGDFPLFVDGFSVTSSVATTTSAGNHTASETNQPGYTAGSWGGDCDETGNITLSPGQNATCTITNDDDPSTTATLTLLKEVINDNGGSAVDTDWTLSANGPTPISGVEGDASITNAVVGIGSYDLSESGPSGYSASAWVCDGGVQDDDDTVTLAGNDNVVCTITNDDDAPSLTLQKVVVNDDSGTEVESAWTLTASGPTGFSGSGPSVSNGVSFDAGTYDLSEAGPAGYTASDWVCVGGNQTDGDTVEVGLGETVTCTITNDDNDPAPPAPSSSCNAPGGFGSIRIFICNIGSIANSTFSSSHTGGNAAGGSAGGSGGSGGNINSSGSENNGGATAGSGGSGGRAGRGGAIVTGDSSSTSTTTNDENTSRVRVGR